MKFFGELSKLINQGDDTFIVVISKELLAQSLTSAAKEH